MIVSTARFGYLGKDGLAVTRFTVNDPVGILFAPSAEILRVALDKRKAGLLSAHWSIYAAAYKAEMRDCYRKHRRAWEDLLARESLTLLCFCPDPERCHRSLLAEMFVACGATRGGEREVVRAASDNATLPLLIGGHD